MYWDFKIQRENQWSTFKHENFHLFLVFLWYGLAIFCSVLLIYNSFFFPADLSSPTEFNFYVCKFVWFNLWIFNYFIITLLSTSLSQPSIKFISYNLIFYVFSYFITDVQLISNFLKPVFNLIKIIILLDVFSQFKQIFQISNNKEEEKKIHI